jgi:hypothetical protein
LSQETFPARAHVRDKDSRLTPIERRQSSLDQLSHLQDSGPHRALTTSNRRPPLAIIKQLVHDNSTAQSKQSQLDSANLQEPRIMLVDQEEILHLILCAAELFEHTDVLAGPPGGVDGDIKAGSLVEEEREFGEDWFRVFSDGVFQDIVRGGAGELAAHVSGDEGAVLNDVFEGSERLDTRVWDGMGTFRSSFPRTRCRRSQSHQCE